MATNTSSLGIGGVFLLAGFCHQIVKICLRNQHARKPLLCRPAMRHGFQNTQTPFRLPFAKDAVNIAGYFTCRRARTSPAKWATGPAAANRKTPVTDSCISATTLRLPEKLSGSLNLDAKSIRPPPTRHLCAAPPQKTLASPAVSKSNALFAEGEINTAAAIPACNPHG
ncbi:MAG: hypothetical protein Q4A62_00795 [Eikenella sp.]|nr:hypothetical protein [Eikenella sp.]